MPSRGDHTKSVIIVLSGNSDLFLTVHLSYIVGMGILWI